MNDQLQKMILSKVKNLPPIPQIASKIIQICEKPDYNVSEIIMLVSKDISLTSAILKFANSAAFSPASEITDLRQATTYIGINNLRNLVISLSLKSVYSKNLDFISQKIWEHSIAVSILARLVSLVKKPDIASEMFTLGMMHDIGQVIFKISIPEYEEFVETAFNNNIPLEEVERNFIGFDHAELGGYTMKAWKMPMLFVDTVYFHHQYQQSQYKNHSLILAYSNNLAKLYADSISKTVNEEEINFCEELLKISQSEKDELINNFKEIYEHEKEMFQLS
ncbi:HDOD domain-containing protein [Deferribacterales bacterium Es71-Z0220]|uniref:HDOD domain-containing protein n=1 Tax=Deferrivibrio essentukiensis TaxID=2880922 RepID=UPI001F613B80|nr:HDOD domain-containing protein [Deferrivibrio essentukiensis]MCB4205018.1 HDOD domain-containing protein [Deferrivibrio essentukiensis]